MRGEREETRRKKGKKERKKNRTKERARESLSGRAYRKYSLKRWNPPSDFQFSHDTRGTSFMFMGQVPQSLVGSVI